MWSNTIAIVRDGGPVYLRLALAAGFLGAVTDRFGFWGPAGGANVAWGDFPRFTAYTSLLNPWAPAALIPPLAWFVTAAEVVLSAALVAGFGTRYVALAAGALLALFALGMTVGTGLKSALNYSVFAASAGAFALAAANSYRWSLDALLATAARRRAEAAGPAVPCHRGGRGFDLRGPVPDEAIEGEGGRPVSGTRE
jgi:thiosulfate dehydrogenase [quinone] large subunit